VGVRAIERSTTALFDVFGGAHPVFFGMAVLASLGLPHCVAASSDFSLEPIDGYRVKHGVLPIKAAFYGPLP
jgi:hypothetical protein